MANALLKAGEPGEAIEHVQTAMRLDPHFPASYLTRLGRAQFAAGQFEDAAETLEKAANQNPDNDWNFVYLAATYGQLGHDDKAKAAITKANEIRSKWGWDALTLLVLRNSTFRWAGDKKSLREGLIKAGVGGGQVDWMALVTTSSDEDEHRYEVEGATIIDVETAKAMNDRGVPFVAVDSRWIVEHIPNAYNMEPDKGEFNKIRLSEIANKEQEVVIYRGGGFVGGRERDAANASAMAVNWGFKVYYFAGGIDAWNKAGHPVEQP